MAIRSGTVTVLFTDLVGSTALLSSLGEEAGDELRRAHFGALRDAIARSDGEEVKNLGDGLMVVFTSVADAVGCAVQMQQGIDAYNVRSDLAPLAIRVGLSIGEATKDEGDWFGTPVVEAARLCARAEGGQILATELVRALAGTRRGHRITSRGVMELKGLPEPLPVCEVSWERAVPGPDLGRIPLPTRLELPHALGFFGRVAEREALEAAWKRAVAGERQVALLAGEPGMGKTRLSSELAREVHELGGVVLWPVRGGPRRPLPTVRRGPPSPGEQRRRGPARAVP